MPGPCPGSLEPEDSGALAGDLSFPLWKLLWSYHPRLQRADTGLLIFFCLERTLKTKSLSAIISVSQKGG